MTRHDIFFALCVGILCSGIYSDFQFDRTADDRDACVSLITQMGQNAGLMQ
jgi:hypothetical protein